jgi:hypothetical protein
VLIEAKSVNPDAAILQAPLQACYNGLRRITTMSKNQRQTSRKPATKFAHLRKKMQQAKTQVKQPRKK